MSCGLVLLARHGALSRDLRQVDAFIREQRGQRQHDARTDGRAALQLEAVDGRSHVGAVVRGRLHHRGGASERDHAHAHMARQRLDECLGRLLRGHQPVGLHIGGAHAARNIHRQHDGLLLRWKLQHRHWSRSGRQQHDQGGHQQSRWHVAAPDRTLAGGLAHQCKAGQPHGRATAAAQQPQVQRHQCRQYQQAPQDQSGHWKFMVGQLVAPSAAAIGRAGARSAGMPIPGRARSLWRRRAV
jgi:hypothetical protein